MNKTLHTILTFQANDFGFLNQNSKAYLLVLIAPNSEIKVGAEFALKNFDTEKDTQALSHFFYANKVNTLGLIKKTQESTLEREVQIIEQKIAFEKSHLIVLLDYKNPTESYDPNQLPSEECFLISSKLFFKFFEKDISTQLSYHFLLKALSKGNLLEQILVHQIGHPRPQTITSSDQKENAEVIIPHRGKLSDLENALWYLKKQNTDVNKISVCFDELVSEQHFQMADTQDNTNFFVNFPSGVGPYPSRDILARSTSESIIIFHDSDDISTIDRVALLTNCLKNEKVDAVGSHELRVNKIKQQIEAVRYPTEVTRNHREKAPYPIFFPTTAIKKSAYLKSGGLSTARKHSSDSQFYMRAHFFMNLKNVDEFLYIRVKHENSLTTALGTALGSLVRERIRQQWEMDFYKIQHRNISLLESSLLDEPSVASFDIIPLKKELRSDILSWQKLGLSLRKKSGFSNLNKPNFPDKKDIKEERILEHQKVDNFEVYKMKRSISWRIGWTITRVIIFLFGWIPFVKKRI